MPKRSFIAAIGLLLTAPGAIAQTVPSGFSVTNLITGGMANPTCFCVAPDGRIFIGQQGGAVRIWKSGSGLLTTPFHQFTVSGTGERGLVGLTLDPDFSNNRLVYAHITRTTPTMGGSIVRVTASPTADVSVPGSQTELFFVGASSSDAHVGGGLHFGPDGKLYLGVGDNIVSSNAQSIANLFGKILRINPDGSIPADNPTSFPGISGTPTGQNRAIWAVGLRNPFSMAFHPVTGRLLINDVGSAAAEEIDDGFAGANFGWPSTEGDFNGGAFPNFSRPLHAYPRTVGVAIVGGTFYAPPVSPYPPAYHGAYFFGDYGAAWIRTLNPTSQQPSSFATGAGNPVDMRVGVDGRLLVLSRGTGRLWRLDYSPPLAPTIIRPPAPQSVQVGASVSLDVVVSGSEVLAYHWRRDMVDLVDGGGVSGARGRVLRLEDVQFAAAGSYDCIVSNAHGTATSAAALLTIDAALRPADTNCDGSVDLFDIDPFILALFDVAAYRVAFPACDPLSGDVTGDGRLDFFDIEPFVDCLINGCP